MLWYPNEVCLISDGMLSSSQHISDDSGIAGLLFCSIYLCPAFPFHLFVPFSLLSSIFNLVLLSFCLDSDEELPTGSDEDSFQFFPLSSSCSPLLTDNALAVSGV